MFALETHLLGKKIHIKCLQMYIELSLFFLSFWQFVFSKLHDLAATN